MEFKIAVKIIECNDDDQHCGEDCVLFNIL